MAIFLKIISGVYFALIWLFTASFVLAAPTELLGLTVWHKFVVVLIAITLTLPAAALYAFGQVVGDVRKSREHLAAMRRYYEPGGQ